MDDFEQAKECFFEGLQLLESNAVEAAEVQLVRSLELIPDRVSTLNNLAVAKLRLGKFAEAEALARRAVAGDAGSAEAWSNLGIALSAVGRHAEALAAHERAVACQPAYARGWLNRAMTLLELHQLDQALRSCERALELEANPPEVLYVQSRILKELGRLQEAQESYRASLELRAATAPAFITERRAIQQADILIVSPNPVVDGTLKSFEALYRECGNFPGQVAAQFKDEFHFSFLFEREATNPMARQRIPRPNVVLNNCANGELLLSRGTLPALVALLDSFGVPVVNHPLRVIQTTRDGTARLLSGIAGIRVPKTQRFSTRGRTVATLVQEIEAAYDYPLITRTLLMQEGKGMNRVDCREALVAVLSANPPEQFFVTEFVDSRGHHGFYRKLRAAVVHDQIFLVRADYDTQWKIYGRKSDERVAFYLNQAHLLEEEERLCQDPAAELGKAALQALEEIRKRIPLEVFGIDFDVDGEGVVVFYEANASMNLLSTARKEVPYPQRAEEALQQALRRYLLSLAAGG